MLVLFLSLRMNSYSQENYKQYFAELIKSQNFTDADSILKYQLKAFSYAKPFPNDLLGTAFWFYKKGNISKANYFFCQAFENGYQIEPDKDYSNLPYKIEYNQGFIDMFKNKKNSYSDFMNFMYSRNKNKIKRLRKKFINKINEIEDAKYEFLLQNEYDFQQIRINILPKKQLPDTIVNIVHKYANIGNGQYMLDLLKNNQFPNRYKCRRFNGQTINILLNHAIASFANKEDAKTFIDLLWKQVENGNLTAKDYANAIDHYTHWYVNSNYTLLGTTTISNDFKTFQCKDVLYPNELNVLRNKYWLETIEIFCERAGFLLPKNYTNK